MTETQTNTDLVLDALGNQTRRDILALLKGQPLPVGAIAAQFPISRPAVSKHLRVLEGAGLVGHEAQGTSNLFYVEPAGFQTAIHYLNQFWDDALANFKQIAETDP